VSSRCKGQWPVCEVLEGLIERQGTWGGSMATEMKWPLRIKPMAFEAMPARPAKKAKKRPVKKAPEKAP
jgi:hypothetical protein